MKTKMTIKLMVLGASLLVSNQLVNAQSFDLVGNTNLTNTSHIGGNAGVNIPLRVWTYGAERIHINANTSGKVGYVGIGTVSPATRLHVNGVVTATGGNSTNWNTAYGWGNHATQGYLKTENDPEVGANTTNQVPRWNGSALVSGVIKDDGSRIGVNTGLLQSSLNVQIAAGATGCAEFRGTTHTSHFSLGGGYNENTFIRGGLDNSNVIIADAGTQKVGIGTATPTARLEVNGAIVAKSFQNTHTQGAWLEWNKDANTGKTYLLNQKGTGIGGFVIGEVDNANNIVERMRITDNGNIGIGTTVPVYQLEITGGAGKPGGGTWSATSDARLKQNVEQFNDGLAQIMKINPVRYHYNSKSGYDTKPEYVGVLAQELKEVASYMVGTFTKDNKEYYNVDNSAMTYMLINAVKEQQNQMHAKDAKIDALTAQMQKFETALSQCCSNFSSANDKQTTVTDNDAVRLEQNAPNPFSTETIIHYYLPSNSTAVLKVTNLEGQEMSSTQLVKTGYGELHISGNTLAAGTYTYTLIVNGKAVESRIMVLTK